MAELGRFDRFPSVGDEWNFSLYSLSVDNYLVLFKRKVKLLYVGLFYFWFSKFQVFNLGISLKKVGSFIVVYDSYEWGFLIDHYMWIVHQSWHCLVAKIRVRIYYIGMECIKMGAFQD